MMIKTEQFHDEKSFTLGISYVFNLPLGIKPDDGQDDGVLFAAERVTASVADQKINLTLANFSNRTNKTFTGNVIVYAVDGQQEHVLEMTSWNSWAPFAGFEHGEIPLCH